MSAPCSLEVGNSKALGRHPPVQESKRAFVPLSLSLGPDPFGAHLGAPFPAWSFTAWPTQGLPRMAHPQVSRPGLYLCPGTPPIPGVGGGLRPPHPPPCAAIRSCRSPHPLVRWGHWPSHLGMLPPVIWPSPGGPCAAPRLCARGSQCCPVPPASLLTSFSNEHGLSLRAHGHVPFLSLFCTPVPS